MRTKKIILTSVVFIISLITFAISYQFNLSSVNNNQTSILETNAYTQKIKNNNINNDIDSNSSIRLDFDKLEVAQTTNEQKKGLMYRKDMCNYCGLLFVFEQEANLSFWMKNTYIPLQIIFLDSSGLVINSQEATPLDESSIPSKQPTKYVLEIKQSSPLNQRIKVGEKIDIGYLKEQIVSFDNSFGKINN